MQPSDWGLTGNIFGSPTASLAMGLFFGKKSGVK